MELEHKTDAVLRFADSMGDSVEFMFGRGLSIECNSDWAGCTETGFGERVEQNISIEQARELYFWLGRALLMAEAPASEPDNAG